MKVLKQIRMPYTRQMLKRGDDAPADISADYKKELIALGVLGDLPTDEPAPAPTPHQAVAPAITATNDELHDYLSTLDDDGLQAFWDAHDEDALRDLLVTRFDKEAKDGWTKGGMENMLEKALGIKE